ncbi:MAG: L-seryl-tRNA(Sec) selenium transferase, partial [Candidatus Latescibacteria bacterium]|nr:L-seryl-tRNA(Sec) selenium transferase [Candidatus Latescibacterota bacterium]
REAIDRLRRAMREGEIVGDSKEALIALVVADVQGVLADQLAPSLRRVVNATGVILHTNLGRAPLPDVAVEQIADIAGYYSNLELDLETGQRGSRTTLVESLLCELTGAEAAAIVNNNAAAVLLMLNTLAEGKEAVVSRGQLVEIGGSFRIPDIMGRSGATMVEVGTTNRTHLKDYEAALTDTTGLMLVVHPSNYKVMGFTAEVMLEDLVTLGKSRGVPVAHDLGGGVLVDLREYGLPYEPLVSDSLTAGVDVVTFSGDKVLGGPQCGIIVGKKDAVEKIRKNPLMRALRCGKLTYAALEATLKMFLNPDALVKSHPTLRMLTESVSILKRRGRRLLALIGEVDDLQIDLVDSKAQTGSGALPLEEIESCAIAIACDGVQAFAERLRRYDLPVMGYVRDDRVFLDLRTMRNDELRVVADAVRWGGLG